MDAANEKIVYVDRKSINKPTGVRPAYHVRPWHRYWARMIDIFVFSVLLYMAIFLIFDYFSLNYLERLILNVGVLIAWVPVEAVLLSTIGSTAGKWLFNIHVRNEQGVKLRWREALNRGFQVLIRGMGGGIPLVSFFCLISAHSKLNYEGATSWDKGNFKIEHTKLGILKRIVCLAAVIGYLYISFIQKMKLF